MLFSLLRGRISIGTLIFFLVTVGIRGASAWLRSHPYHAPAAYSYQQPAYSASASPAWLTQPNATSQSQTNATSLVSESRKTFVSAADLILNAQAATPQPTPRAALDDRTYVNTIWDLLGSYIDQYNEVSDATDKAVEQGAMPPVIFNTHMRAIAAKANRLHAIANDIRALNPPANFGRYHRDVLAAIKTVEVCILANARLTDSPDALSAEDTAKIQADFVAAIEVLTAAPRP